MNTSTDNDRCALARRPSVPLRTTRVCLRIRGSALTALLTCALKNVIFFGKLADCALYRLDKRRIDLVAMVQRQRDKWSWTDKRRKFVPSKTRYDDLMAVLLDPKLGFTTTSPSLSSIDGRADDGVAAAATAEPVRLSTAQGPLPTATGDHARNNPNPTQTISQAVPHPNTYKPPILSPLADLPPISLRAASHYHNMLTRKQKEHLSSFFDRILDSYRAEDVPQEHIEKLAGLKRTLLNPCVPTKAAKDFCIQEAVFAFGLEPIGFDGFLDGLPGPGESFMWQIEEIPETKGFVVSPSMRKFFLLFQFRTHF